MNGNEEHWETPEVRRPDEKPCLPSVSSALVLGSFLGLGEAFILTVLAGPILTLMGVDAVSLSFDMLLQHIKNFSFILHCSVYWFRH
jgi:hypothetical protein